MRKADGYVLDIWGCFVDLSGNRNLCPLIVIVSPFGIVIRRCSNIYLSTNLVLCAMLLLVAAWVAF